MRRRAIPVLIAVPAVGVALWRRSRRRAVRHREGVANHAIARETGNPAVIAKSKVEPEVQLETSRFLSVPWSPYPDPPPRDATELRIHLTLTSEAMELARVDVRETASQVFVTVLARWNPAVGEQELESGAGSGSGRKREATASLRSPLGDRALVHAPHDTTPAPPG